MRTNPNMLPGAEDTVMAHFPARTASAQPTGATLRA